MKILICSDGSRQADNAVRFGALLAAACEAEVTLLGIVEQPALEEDLQNALRRSQQVLKEKHVTVEVTARAGEPVAEIVKQTRQIAYDLVVIGAVRKGNKGAFWMSAKAYKLIKGLETPVLVVVGHPQELKRILICSGGAPYINKAVQFAGKIAQGSRANATLVHVFAQPPALYSDLITRLEDVDGLLNSRSTLGHNLSYQKKILESIGVQTNIKLRQGPVVWQLLEEVHEGHYDLLVLGLAPPAGAFRTYIMGNITRELINRTDCPMLVVQATQKPPGFLALLQEIFTAAPKPGGPPGQDNTASRNSP